MPPAFRIRSVIVLFLPAATPAGIVIVSFILIFLIFRYFARKGHISPPKGLKLGMELILDTRNPMVGSKLTLKVIFKAKKAKIELRENIRILAVLTKFYFWPFWP